MAAGPGPRARPGLAAKPLGRPAKRCAAMSSLWPPLSSRLNPRNSTSAMALWWTKPTAPNACHSTNSRAWPFAFTNGIQGSHLEVDIDTGFVKLLKHWCVEDCGTIINPQLVDEQIRGGVVQGIGAALFEHCLYDERGQLLNGNMADYLVPMAAEMPDIECGHVVSPTADSELGAKGAGEAGTAGAPGSIMNAVNDALRPLGAEPLTDMPFTPDKILRALGKV